MNVIEFLRNNPQSPASTIAIAVNKTKAETNAILYTLKRIGVTDYCSQPPLWSLDNEEAFKEYLTVLRLLTAEFVSIDVLSRDAAMPKSQLNPILYSLASMELAECKKDERGTKPHWKAL